MPASSEAVVAAGGARPGHRPLLRTRASAESATRGEEGGLKQSPFENKALPYVLLAPQLLVLLFFFFIPSFRALIQAFQLADPFGNSTQWVGLDNLEALMRSAPYWAAVRTTIVFTLALSLTTLGVAVLLAFAAHHVLRGQALYKTFILVPYAIAPAIAGIVWAFLFNPAVGPIAHALHANGIAWDPNRYASHAMILIVLASAWKQVPYNFLFLFAGLLAIPRSVLEAAAVDGAGPIRRFVSISLPLLSPTLFFLVVINFVYGFFETFAVVDATTRGGPAGATTTMVYKVYQDGFVSLDLGSSAAQSIILMALALGLTFVQFRYLESRVRYAV
jgi:sn-glycerol 3-phosphate transport system permease protein